MKLEIDRAASLRLKASKLLQLARDAAEPRRADLTRLAEDHAREAWSLSREGAPHR